MNFRKSLPLIALLLTLSLNHTITAQSAAAPNLALDALSSWVALEAPTGHEQQAINQLRQDYPNWQQDRYGNLTRTIGSGSPHRVVACGIDAPAYAISQITDEGYLRVHRIGAGSRHPLWDQTHEGQQLRVLTREGPLVVVAAVRNGHFSPQHASRTTLATENDLWLDAGAESAAEIAEMGIQLLDPVVRNLPAWSYGNEVAGPNAGARVSCAAVLAAGEARLNGSSGSTSYVLSVQQVFAWPGLGAALRWLPPAEELLVLGPGATQARNEIVNGFGSVIDAVLGTSAAAVDPHAGA